MHQESETVETSLGSIELPCGLILGDPGGVVAVPESAAAILTRLWQELDGATTVGDYRRAMTSVLGPRGWPDFKQTTSDEEFDVDEVGFPSPNGSQFPPSIERFALEWMPQDVIDELDEASESEFGVVFYDPIADVIRSFEARGYVCRIDDAAIHAACPY